MSSIAQEAAREYILLTLGVRSEQDVVSWADNVIMREQSPSDEIIELSTTSVESAKEIETQLLKLKEGSDHWVSVRQSLGPLHDYLQKHPENTKNMVHALYKIFTWGFPNTPDDLRFVFQFDDAFSVPHQGIDESLNKVAQEFIVALSRFKSDANSEFSIQNS